MMDAAKFLKEQSRICRSYAVCNTCPLNGNLCSAIADDSNIDEKIAIVEKWSKEHPVKTRLSEIQKIFPKIVVRDKDLPIVCPSHLDAEWDCIENCEECKIKYWLEEIE